MNPAITPRVIRGLHVLRAGVYQASEAMRVAGWERGFTPQAHRDVDEARRWLNRHLDVPTRQQAQARNRREVAA